MSTSDSSNIMLNIPKFINVLNDPAVNQKFVIIMKTSGSLAKPNSFRFEPDLYSHLLSLSAPIKDLVQHFYDIGVEKYPICSRFAIYKLFPGIEFDNHTFQITKQPAQDRVHAPDQVFNQQHPNLAQLVKAELYDQPLDVLLSRYIDIVYNHPVQQLLSYDLTVIIHIGHPDLGLELLSFAISSTQPISSSNKQTLIFITVSCDILITNPDYIQTLIAHANASTSSTTLIISTTTNLGTDIQPYFMALHYLETNGYSANYILKLHTKSDSSTRDIMLNTFAGNKLSQSLDYLDNTPGTDIIGSRELIMPNYHVKGLLPAHMDKYLFVAGSSFLSKADVQHRVLKKYAGLIKQSLFNTQYYTGWLFDKNSPAHALERYIGGFESQAAGQLIQALTVNK